MCNVIIETVIYVTSNGMCKIIWNVLYNFLKYDKPMKILFTISVNIFNINFKKKEKNSSFVFT